MEILKDILPTKMYEIVDRAGICTPKQLIILSIWDIKKVTGLKTVDIEMIKKVLANHLNPQLISCHQLLLNKQDRVTSGCSDIDNLLKGGFRKGVLTEIYGESGSGKTQLGMQVSANNAIEGSVYICTEDLFPIKRYNQIHQRVKQDIDHLTNNVFVEHVYEILDLQSCVRVRLPKLLQQHKVSVVILDSIAAPFRCESSNYIQRAEELRELAIMLIKIAQDYNLAVVCFNQVTADFDGSSGNLLPSLGLAWSNMISYRFWLRKTSDNRISCHKAISTRELKTIFAPDLPKASCYFIITTKGVMNIDSVLD